MQRGVEEDERVGEAKGVPFANAINVLWQNLNKLQEITDIFSNWDWQAAILGTGICYIKNEISKLKKWRGIGSVNCCEL